MVRAPCCEKMGMKKGPWTPEEDQVLIDYIQQYGHGNWRALPRHAGLLRCGKSCRLRWTNYLRPDIKRGNFSREEEETVIELHETLGNRWSAIAARLPGRTDNEIKNVWHTHLKKKAALRKNNNHDQEKLESGPQSSIDTSSKIDQNIEITNITNHATSSESTWYVPVSSQQQQQSCSDISISSSSDISSTLDDINMFLFDSYKVESPGDFPEVDESFWSEVLSTEVENFSGGEGNDLPEFEVDPQLQFQLSPLLAMDPVHNACNMHYDDGLDFWLAEGMTCFT